ncbi:MAG TPA: SHOCT domain-containing protein [Isosphaeraceae bacterium]|nr:SHOCT domain-containing protein [Isosphaeraceae bacterium]
MKTKAAIVGCLILAALLVGCATSDKLNYVHIGMTKDQVVAVLGTPDSTSAQANVEYLTYYLTAESGYGRDQPYMIRLVNAKVESFGRFAQLFDLYNRPVTSATPGDPNFPALGISAATGVALPAVQAGVPDLAGEIQRLKALRDSGALTDEEFQKAKAKVLGDAK